MDCPPTQPHETLVPFQPSAIRTLKLFGIPVELALVPDRRARSGHVHELRPALQRSPADRIIRSESYWRTDGLALTPNKFPFAKNQRILWMAQPAREPNQRFWETALAWAKAADGSVLLNNIGAAATIPRAHAHLIAEKLPFLTSLPERALQSDLIDVPSGCELSCTDLPVCIIGVRGDLTAMATAIMRLADARLTSNWNVVATSDVAWIIPRAQQTPTPYFSDALGAAEIWGRWCFVERDPFEQASSEDLEQALAIATKSAIP
jgi:hypothetical protein